MNPLGGGGCSAAPKKLKSFPHSAVWRIGLVAGEASGDWLGAGLIQAFKSRGIILKAEGIAGPRMLAQGCVGLAPIDKLAVMGIAEVGKRLPELLSIRRRLYQHFITHPPDVFIGIDAPDFNLGLEKKLRKQGIPCIHYVSPTVWAWRRYRLRTIAKAVDLMLTLFPFETQYYQQYRIPVQFVGHPFADDIPLTVDSLAARQQLRLPLDQPLIALLPGSRENEIHYLGSLFIETAQYCAKQVPQLQFITPTVTEACKQQFMAIAQAQAPELRIHFLNGQSRLAMAAADVVVLASGSATLEAMLLKKPMVVAYRMSRLSYTIARLLVKVSHIALPNLLAGKTLVPEFIQAAATVENLGQATLHYLQNPSAAQDLKVEFNRLHEQLRCNASAQATQAILKRLYH